MAITPEDLITKSFKIVTNESGYDRNEVDDFLDELVVELRTLYSERDALERKVEQLSTSAPAPAAETSAPAAPAKASAGTQDAAALLAMAQKVHDEYVAQGEKAKAELLSQAGKKAEALVSEAHQQREEILGRLINEKEELEIAVEALRGFESRYRSKLMNYLSAQVHELKNLKSIEASA